MQYHQQAKSSYATQLPVSGIVSLLSVVIIVVVWGLEYHNTHRYIYVYKQTDGNGREPKPFKIEWATEKDNLLYIGSFGKEWVVDGV